MVYLIGAGPGDPGLISARGLQCLAAADVVVYDHLVHPRLLSFAQIGAEAIDVGAKSPKPLEEEAICYLLAEKAREGKTVARLKIGDPFVFDPTGEEALFLHEQGVPFEVVPGVPVAVGVPSYAGIPVTYAGAGDALVILRGRHGGTELPQVDWASLANLKGTLVCHASPRQLGDVIHALIAHGYPADEPAAIIAQGTLPGQQSVEGTLGELQASAPTLVAPDSAVLVVGRVTRFRKHLSWFEERPLFGKRILVTRARSQAHELVERLEALGAEAIESPTIRVVAVEDPTLLDEACATASQYDWIVLTSVNGVDAFMQRIQAGPGDVRDLKGVKFCAVGPATAARLGRYGIKVDLTPPEYRTEAIVTALRQGTDLEERRILLPRADIASDVLTRELRKAGAEVNEVTAYRTLPVEPGQDGEPDVYGMLLENRIDIVTFTSASTVRNFVRMHGSEAAPDLLRSTLVACIGPVTAEAARQSGIEPAIMPTHYTIPALVEAIAAHVTGAEPSPPDSTSPRPRHAH